MSYQFLTFEELIDRIAKSGKATSEEVAELWAEYAKAATELREGAAWNLRGFVAVGRKPAAKLARDIGEEVTAASPRRKIPNMSHILGHGSICHRCSVLAGLNGICCLESCPMAMHVSIKIAYHVGSIVALASMTVKTHA
ncbi:MAG: hypothetical protein Q9216_003025 [Gyalolechia sp. 2 TL-2023]